MEVNKRPDAHRRSMSFADDPLTETEVVIKPKKGMRRSLTLATIADAQEHADEQEADAEMKEEQDINSNRLIPDSIASDFHILRLDLKLGTHGSANSPASLVSQLEKNSIANLLDERIAASLKHIEKLRLRIEDTSSKVLVTGDLNAGKSTLVNALIRREVMPVDQQPCTTAFCEVHDVAENEGVEEAHIVKEGATYDIKDESTYVRAKISDLGDIVSENESAQPIIKLYMSDARAPTESFLNNGIVDISLIDAPGLNRDSLKTTALFTRQEEIDVVVFVVSAENHFTLSAKEFLQNASNEKAYIFIVVNKYDQIRDKNKCRRLILEQVKALSPRTFDDAADLVHFVDSSSVLGSQGPNASFDTLESALRSFVLVKRSKSKLHPASTYLSHVLSDTDLLAGANAIVAQAEFERAQENLAKTRPVLEKMKNERDTLEDGLESVEEEGAGTAGSRTKEILTRALERVGGGELALEKSPISLPPYPGFLNVWDYARDVRKAFLASLDLAVKLAEDEARVTTSNGVSSVARLGDKFLPEGVERSRRIFMPEAMFLRRDTGKNSARRSTIVAGGIYGLGIGLAQRSDLLNVSFFDLFDAQHQFSLYFGDGKSNSTSGDSEELVPSALSVVSIGVGALTMVGGKAFGARGVLEGILRVTDLFGNESSRRWAAPVLGACAIGLSAYFILELPSSIPRTVGRRVRATLVRPETEDASEDTTFVNAHAGRIGRETRKVLRIASWDLRERFRGAMEERAREVKGAEELEKQAKKAVGFFTEVERKTGEIRSGAGLAGAA